MGRLLDIATQPGTKAPRGNLFVEGIALVESTDAGLPIRVARFEITGDCDSCFVRDERHEGLRSALGPEWRGASIRRVLRGGKIPAGNHVWPLRT